MQINLMSSLINTKDQNLNSIYSNIADFILKNFEGLKNITIIDLANKTYTSKSTILRFCKYLGYPGYKNFIYDLNNLNKVNSNTILEKYKLSDDDNSYLNLCTKNMQQTFQINHNQINKIKLLLNSNKNIYLFGVGINQISMKYFKSIFAKYSGKIYFDQDIDEQTYFAEKLIQNGEIALFFSFTAETPSIVNLWNLIKTKNISIITITNNIQSNLAMDSEIVISLQGNESVLENRQNGVMSTILILNYLYLKWNE